MSEVEPKLYVLAASALQVMNWAIANNIPRSRVVPLIDRNAVQRIRGLSTIHLFRHDTWAHCDMQAVHEIQHRLSTVRDAGGTVMEVQEDHELNQFRNSPAPPPPMSEDDFKTRVIQYAKLRGWMVVHYRPAKTAKGYRTALEGDPGCPDLILARNGVVILAELKSQKGRVRPEQRPWLQHLGEHGRLWRPSDWPDVQKLLA